MASSQHRGENVLKLGTRSQAELQVQCRVARQSPGTGVRLLLTDAKLVAFPAESANITKGYFSSEKVSE